MLILRNQQHTIAQTARFLKSTLFHSVRPIEAKEETEGADTRTGQERRGERGDKG